ncbi:MAG TPA: hypothetical protein QF359_07940, partial [Rhodospirillales bacterium]|nr:hypothetical protein [Rhodospirillales bacterium]
RRFGALGRSPPALTDASDDEPRDGQRIGPRGAIAGHLARAVKRILYEQLVDPPHQRQVLRALAFRGVISTASD